MDKLEVYGQCPKCGGSLVVGHRCPKSMVGRSLLKKTEAELEALINKWKEVDEPDLQARLAANRELFRGAQVVVWRAARATEKDFPRIYKQLTDLLLLLKAAAKEMG